MRTDDSDIKIISEIEKSIESSKGITSPANIAADTGYSLDIINDYLPEMLENYDVKVRMNSNNGSLELIFTYPLTRRNRKSFKQILFNISVKIWEIFKKIYRASFGIILIFYTILFIIILIGGKTSGNRNSRSSGNSLAGVFQIIGLAIRFITVKSAFDRFDDSRGLRYRRPSKHKNKGKNWIISAFNFVLGPERVDHTPLDSTKEVIAYVKLISNGKLTAADIVHLSGITYDSAESLLAEYAGKFHGELYINNDGYVECFFPKILNDKITNVSKGDIIYYQDEIEAPYKITDNTKGKNISLSLMNSFNLIMSYIMFSVLDYSIFDVQDSALIFLKVLLGYFPLLFSLLFFLIPLFRIPYVIKRKQDRKKNIIRKVVFRYVYKYSSKPINEDNIIEEVKSAKLNQESARQILQDMIIDFRGTIFIGDNGEKLYDFTKFNNELTAK